MKKIHIVSILDRSGSMSGTESEVIGAYNAFVEQQTKITEEKGVKAKFSLILFDNQYEEVYTKLSAKEVPELTSEVYYTRGMTALYDSIGKTINTFEGKKNAIFFIETDGFENSSTEFTQSKVKELVDRKTKEGWDFNFVGADLDTATVGNMSVSLGIAKSMSFDKSGEGYRGRNASFAASTVSFMDTNN
jgi:uncharacterized protein with von Willebrand factor type A (vWA) domain